jgi:hypothetical protein
MTNHKIQYDRLKSLPPIARTLCYNHDGWIVGSNAEYLLGLRDEFQRDIDILVPFYEWGNACRIIPAGTPSNSFGGFKLLDNGIEIDIWAGDIGWFIAQVPNKPVYAVHVKSYTTLIGVIGYSQEKPKSKGVWSGEPIYPHQMTDEELKAAIDWCVARGINGSNFRQMQLEYDRRRKS